MEADPRDRRIAELEEQLAELNRQLEQALARVAELEQTAARQAAPFRREPRNIIPPPLRKKPGRKKGHEGFFRQAPPEVDQVIDLPLDRCPRCGGAVSGVRCVEQVIEEIPPVRPTVIKLLSRRGICACCGEVGTSHPLQQSLAVGAARVQIGPRAVALATILSKVCGLTMRKTTWVLRQLCGLSLSAGGLSHAMARAAQRCQKDYQQLLMQIRSCPAVNVDETSWWVGGPGKWLWCFTTPTGTLFHVDRRGSQVVKDVLGEQYRGVLVSDCLSSYDPIDCRKHKCFAHHLRAIKAAEPLQKDQSYLIQWKRLLSTASALWRMWDQIDPRQQQRDRLAMEAWKDRLLEQVPSGPGAIKVRNRLIKHRQHLLRCLEEPRAEPTNNRAERALRPAVICRKLSCGNKTERGKQTWQTLASLGYSCTQRGEDFVQWLSQRLVLKPAR